MASITASEIPQTATRPAVRGDRFLAITLLLLAGVFVAYTVIAGAPQPFFVLPAAIYAALGLALLRWAPRWLIILAMVLPGLYLAATIVFVAPGLAHPDSPGNFVPDSLIIITSATAVAGGIVALRRGEHSRRWLAITAGTLAAAVVVVATIATLSVSNATMQPGDIAVTAENLTYPQHVEAAAGDTLYVHNADPFRHTFTVEGTDISAELPGSTAARIAVDLDPGTYKFFCSVTGHETMQGALVIN